MHIYSIHAYPAQDMTPGWEIGSASLHAPNPRGLQSVDGAHWKSCSSIACCKAESNWVFGICKTKEYLIDSPFSMDLFGLLPTRKKLPKHLYFVALFCLAGRMRFTSLVPKAFPKSKSSRFRNRRGRWRGIVEARKETQKWGAPGIGDSELVNHHF